MADSPPWECSKGKELSWENGRGKARVVQRTRAEIIIG